MLKYEIVTSDIINKVNEGTYGPNSKLPSAVELCAQYGVSKITVKKAMDELERLGVVSRRRGSGTFVKDIMRNVDYDKDWSQATRILGIKAQCEAEGISVRTIVNSFSVITPTPRVADALNMTDGFVYSICRTRIMNDKPSSVEYTYMPISVIPGLSTEILEDSIYDYIEHKLGLSIDSAHSIIRASLPDEREREWLEIPSGYPLLEVEQVAFLSDGTAFEFSTTRNTRENGEVRTIRLHRKE